MATKENQHKSTTLPPLGEAHGWKAEVIQKILDAYRSQEGHGLEPQTDEECVISILQILLENVGLCLDTAHLKRLLSNQAQIPPFQGMIVVERVKHINQPMVISHPISPLPFGTTVCSL